MNMAKKNKTSFKKKKEEHKHNKNNREEYSAEFNAVIHNNTQKPKQRQRPVNKNKCFQYDNCAGAFIFCTLRKSYANQK